MDGYTISKTYRIEELDEHDVIVGVTTSFSDNQGAVVASSSEKFSYVNTEENINILSQEVPEPYLTSILLVWGKQPE